jgi:hypothetical protein
LIEKENSPYGHEDWYAEKLSWKWINTVMRVNSLVQKVRVDPLSTLSHVLIVGFRADSDNFLHHYSITSLV